MMSPAGLGTVGAAAMTTSIVLPSLNRARETANRVHCASNMRRIGEAMSMYAAEHDGQLPPDLGMLIVTQEITLNEFTCPSGNVSVPADVANGKPEGMARWANEKSPYVYVGKGKTNREEVDVLLVYEKIEDLGGEWDQHDVRGRASDVLRQNSGREDHREREAGR